MVGSYQLGFDAAKIGKGRTLWLKFYWVAVAFFWRYHPKFFGQASYTGMGFYWKPNKELKEGACIWLRERLWLWPHPNRRMIRR